MKDYRSPNGERRLWFEESEIEEIMAHELRQCEMFPSASIPLVDMEAFLELHLQVRLDLYCKLSRGLLGVSTFITGRQPVVEINRDLTEQANENDSPGGLLGRWRATLAHEAAHVILHRRLVERPKGQGILFSHDVEAKVETTMTRCLERHISFARGTGDWKEVQANLGMAALLMPSRPFTDLVRFIVGVGPADDLLAGIPAADTQAYTDLIQELARRCHVSQEAARIRLDTLGLARSSSEPMLELAP